jgi:hypothetical protein
MTIARFFVAQAVCVGVTRNESTHRPFLSQVTPKTLAQRIPAVRPRLRKIPICPLVAIPRK